jgi:hypothetical protein
MASKPKIPPPAPPPAARVERDEAASPEDIVLGGMDEIDQSSMRKKGKRALTRPSSGVVL